MNKDVIYIEPEDDITDIINRIKTAKQKVVALVPPKKLGVLRSAVNVKLIAKTAKASDKAVVIITTDTSLIKMSAMAGLPISKNLNSRPILPSEFINRKKAEKKTEEVTPETVEAGENAEEKTESTEAEAGEESAEVAGAAVKAKKDDVEIDSDEIDDAEKDKKKKKDNKVSKIPNFDKYRKWIIIGATVFMLLIVFLVWALVIAPFVKISVKLRASSYQISENVTLVTNEKDVDINAGKFLLEQIKYEDESSVEFDATGTANHGEKATGTIVLGAVFANPASVVVPAGTVITNGDLSYATKDALTITLKETWSNSDCANKTTVLQDGGCIIYGRADVVATEAGTKYNIESAKNTGWKIEGRTLLAYTDSAITGGTDKMVKIVTESDIEDAKSQLENNEEAKQKLFEQINEGMVSIESTFKVEAKEPVSKPAKNEVVEEGKKAKLTAKTTYTIYVVDRVAIDNYAKNFMTTAGQLADNDVIYNTGTPHFERVLENDKTSYTAKLKTNVKFGPEISEKKILETIKGRKIGEVRALVKDISRGVVDVKADANFPWVYSVPNDENKVEIKLETED
jgi:hypothetical protein